MDTLTNQIIEQKSINSEAEYEHAIGVVVPLFDKGGDNISRDEMNLLVQLSTLIEDFEEKHYAINAATPLSILKEIMDARGMTQAGLAEILNSRSRASEILSGKRAITLEQAKKLAAHFNVSVELFI